MPVSATDHQVVRAYRLILRYLRREGARPGDIVVKQQELQRELNLATDTVTLAMRELVADGVLERRRKAGTHVVSLSRARFDQHTVMLVVVPEATMAQQPFYAYLLRALGRFVRQLTGAQIRVMLDHSQSDRNGKDWPAQVVSEVMPLVEAGEIDAIISSISVNESAVRSASAVGVPWLHVGASEIAPAGVVIDQRPLVLEASSMLWGRGCRRIALVEQNDFDRPQSRSHVAYRESAQHLGYEAMPVVSSLTISLTAGRRVGRQLLQMPRRQRPDGLIVLNDVVASGLTDILRDQSDYRPEIAVQANVPGTLIFGVPVIRFDVEVNSLARQVVTMLHRRWAQPEDPAVREWLLPRMSDERATDVDFESPQVSLK